MPNAYPFAAQRCYKGIPRDFHVSFAGNTAAQWGKVILRSNNLQGFLQHEDYRLPICCSDVDRRTWNGI